jgi:hypothetical protein
MFGNLPGHVAGQRERTSGGYEVNAMLGADGDNALHIGSAGPCKLLSATRKKRLEARRTCLNEDPAWSVPDILESVNDCSGHEHHASRSRLMPLIVVEKSYFPFLNQKQFILIQMIVRRRASARRSDLRPEGKFSSGLHTGQMEDNLFAKRIAMCHPRQEQGR